MGNIITITCRNKNCRHHMELKTGDGFSAERKANVLEETLRETKSAEDKILDLLDKGCHINYRSVYACPSCREWVEYNSPYIFEPIKKTPLGTVREYKIHYVHEKPACKKCGSDLYHIFNPLSTNNPCPKCGADNMNAKIVGNWD